MSVFYHLLASNWFFLLFATSDKSLNDVFITKCVCVLSVRVYFFFLSFFKADCNELLCDGGLVCDCVRSPADGLLVDRTCREGGFSFFFFL